MFGPCGFKLPKTLISAAFLTCMILASTAATSRADTISDCHRALLAEGVHFKRAAGNGLQIGVSITDSKLGGVTYQGYKSGALIIDCSLAVSLARTGPYIRSLGISKVTYSSAYQRRNIRGTNRPSRHSFGLAIDIHTFHLDGGGAYRMRDDYEQGLGTIANCVGTPLTAGGALLRTLDCEMSQSGEYRIILSPDYDAHHYNHFHVEAMPWEDRDTRISLAY